MGEISKLTTTSKTLKHGVTIVGTTRVRVGKKIETNHGIMVRAPGIPDVDAGGSPLGNDGVVYIGDERVTADHSNTGGFPLVPGTAVVLPTNDPSEIWAIATKPNSANSRPIVLAL